MGQGWDCNRLNLATNQPPKLTETDGCLHRLILSKGLLGWFKSGYVSVGGGGGGEVGVKGKRFHNFAYCKIPFLWTTSIGRQNHWVILQKRTFFSPGRQNSQYSDLCSQDRKHSDPLLFTCPFWSKEGNTNRQWQPEDYFLDNIPAAFMRHFHGLKAGFQYRGGTQK